MMNMISNVVLRLEQIDGVEYYVLYDRDKQVPLGRMEVDCDIGVVKDEEKLTPMERAIYDIQAVEYESNIYDAQALEYESNNNPDDGSWKNR